MCRIHSNLINEKNEACLHNLHRLICYTTVTGEHSQWNAVIVFIFELEFRFIFGILLVCRFCISREIYTHFTYVCLHKTMLSHRILDCRTAACKCLPTNVIKQSVHLFLVERLPLCRFSCLCDGFYVSM